MNSTHIPLNFVSHVSKYMVVFNIAPLYLTLSVHPSVAINKVFPSCLIYHKVGQIFGSSYAEHNL